MSIILYCGQFAFFGETYFRVELQFPPQNEKTQKPAINHLTFVKMKTGHDTKCRSFHFILGRTIFTPEGKNYPRYMKIP